MEDIIKRLIEVLNSSPNKFAENPKYVELLKKLRNTIDKIVYKSKSNDNDREI